MKNLNIRILRKGLKKMDNIEMHSHYTLSTALILLVCIVLVSGCGEMTNEDLTRLPKDQISNDQYWSSANDMKLYVNQFYPSFVKQFAFWHPVMYYADGNSDNMAPITDPIGNIDRIAGLLTPQADAGWANWYSNIRDVNEFVVNVEENNLLTNPEANRYMGEARFFRAYFYYQLVKNYGPVPWITKPLNTESEELQSPRTPRNQVVDNILADLDFAIEHLPPKSETGNNRLNKETALLFDSRVALFEGTWEKYHNGTPFAAENSNPQKYLQRAAESAKALIDMGTASLASNYAELFNQDDLDGNPEILLERQYNAELGMSAMVQRRIPRHGGGTGLTKSLVESYLVDDGNPIAVSSRYQGDDTLIDVVTNRDPRLHAILKVPGDILAVNSDGSPRIFEKPRFQGGGVLPTTTGYELKKGANPNNGIPGQGQQGPALPLFRYAEALLNYAEAKAELGNITQQDLDISVNVLRDRVNMPHLQLGNIATDPNWNYPNLSPQINEIRRERRVELACEQFRLIDIMRWAAGDELLVGHIPLGYKFQPSDYPTLTVGDDIYLNEEGYVEPYRPRFPNGYGFDVSRDYLYPIPPEELNLAGYEQNPGWPN